MKRIFISLLIFAFILTSCGTKELLSPSDGDKNPLGQLTNVQIREDFDFFFDTIRESYPFIGVAQRKEVFLDILYEKYEKKLVEINNDKDYISFFKLLISEFSGLGHMQFLSEYWEYKSHVDIYADVIEYDSAKYLYESMTSSLTSEAYKRLLSTDEDGEIIENPPSEVTINLLTDIRSENEIAYIKPFSFNHFFIEKDAAILKEFFKEIENIPYLIIDLRGNGGGDESYWIDCLVAPNISAALTVETYSLYNKTEMASDYLSLIFELNESNTVESLDIPIANPEDLENLTHYIKKVREIQPIGENPYLGEIYLLVDGGVYSASESFTTFCKKTGFAKVVGTETRGSGGEGVTPPYFALPNSGMLWRNEILYTLNGDGTSNAEHGTTPDIISTGDPLKFCFKLIEEDKEEE